MYNINQIALCKQIIEVLKEEDKTCTQNKIEKTLQKKGVIITHDGLHVVLEFLLNEGYITKAFNIQSKYWFYSHIEKAFTYDDYILSLIHI